MILRQSTRPGYGDALRLSRAALLPSPVRRFVGMGILIAWFLRTITRLLVAILRRPALLVAAAGTWGVWWFIDRFGTGLASITLGAFLVALWAWSRCSPATFDRCIENPARARWRRRWVYLRQWQPAMVTAGLALDAGTRQHLPTLRRVRSTPAVDIVRVRTLWGQTPDQWTKAAEQLARTWSVREVRIREVPGRPRLLDLVAMTGDPLAAPVPLIPPAGNIDLEHVPVGVTETGDTATLRLLYSHLLVAGVTGAGKGSVLWSLLVAVAPSIRAGTVRVWAIDPKGGMELSAGAPMFDRFVWGEPQADGTGWEEPIARTLEDAVRGMQARAARLRGTTRKLVPSPVDPLIVVVIDEIASLTSYVRDPKLRRRIGNALSLLLSQGRAVGVCVVAATQDARKEVISMRDLFPTRVALRAAEPEQADMVLGRGARDRGALTDRIPDRLPGIGYVVVEDNPQPVRVRFSHVTDHDIEDVAALYRPPARPTRQETPA